MNYLSGVLTVIAVCLVLITFAVTGIIPSANAKETNPRTVTVPVNPDGSITVKMAKGETIDVNVNLATVAGRDFNSSNIPVEIKNIYGVPVEIRNNSISVDVRK